jgi:hypothetical protein
MTDASLCGLGQTAASAVLSAMKTWPELFSTAAKKPALGGGSDIELVVDNDLKKGHS